METLNMKKLFIILTFTFFIISKGYAATATGDPTKYEITVKKVELCTDATCTGTPYVVGEKSMAADIASATSGATVGQFAPTNGIPAGQVFTHLRVTMDRTLNITASIAVGGGTCRTDGGNNAAATQMTVGTSGGNAAPEEMYLVNAGGFGVSDGTRDGATNLANDDIDMSYATPTYAVSMSVSGDLATMIYKLESPYQRGIKSPLIKVSFNTANSIGTENTACSMWINEPSVTISLQ